LLGLGSCKVENATGQSTNTVWSIEIDNGLCISGRA
jgi:hypothetical protein